MKPSTARSELDSMIREIELTLVSIIQGVALTVLIETAKDVMTESEWTTWPYVLAGLFVIFVFWSRAVLHIITVIRWPLEFGHNFLYIACALVESIALAQLATPLRWFWAGAAFIIVGWMLFTYDLRLIRARMQDSAGEMSNRLFALVMRDQILNIALLLPAVFVLNLVCAMLIRAWPEFFLARNGHVYLVAIQLVAFAGYLFYVVKFYLRLAPLIDQARSEWKTNNDADNS